MLLQRTILFVTPLLILFASCSTPQQKAQKWYDETKAKILAQGASQPDSVVTKFNRDSSYKEEHFFFHGNIYWLKGYEKGKLSLESHYTRDGNWRFTHEWCGDGRFDFEGVMYQDNGYGLSTWRYCNGKIEEVGVRYNNEEIGTWKYYNEDGTFKKQVDYLIKESPGPMPAINSGQ